VVVTVAVAVTILVFRIKVASLVVAVELVEMQYM
jgi:hypothetical protein